MEAECSIHDLNCCMITSLPDTVLLFLASYLVPPDVYRLAQTCKKFHSPSSELSTLHFLSSPYNPREKPSLDNMQYNEVKNLASRLLQESLIHGFTTVIQLAMTDTAASRIIKFQEDELSMGQKVLLSGSAAVQSVTGKRFKQFDLNFFCTRKSVSRFRELMRDMGYCCESVVPYNCEQLDACLHDSFEANIHHVETFIPRRGIETVAMSAIIGGTYRAWNAQLAALQGDEEVSHELDRVDMSFWNVRNQYLYDLQKQSRYRFRRDYPVALIPPNNFIGSNSDDTYTRKKSRNGIIQLVVCLSCPKLTITMYDMDICKSSFDGESVNIASMSDTFNFRTNVSDDYFKFINCYVPNFLSTANNGEFALTGVSDKDTAQKILYIIYCVKTTAANFDSLIQRKILGPNIFNMLHQNTESSESTMKIYFCRLHNNIVRLLQRALKYFDRGIDVPLSDNVKSLLSRNHFNPQKHLRVAPPSKRLRLHTAI